MHCASALQGLNQNAADDYRLHSANSAYPRIELTL